MKLAALSSKLQRILEILWNMLHMVKMLWNKLNLLTIDLLQKAEAELAYELQAAKTKQRIKEENMQIKVTTALLTKKTEMNPLDQENNVPILAQVIERTQEIAIQSQEIQRRERELDRWRQKQEKLFRDSPEILAQLDLTQFCETTCRG